MSSLTRSLLALAVLLVAANAQDNCNQVTYGQTTDKTLKLREVITPEGGGRVSYKDGCPSQYPASGAVGETIIVCNVDPNGVAPSIEEVNPPDFLDVDVTVADKNKATVNTVQYCAMAYSS